MYENKSMFFLYFLTISNIKMNGGGYHPDVWARKMSINSTSIPIPPVSKGASNICTRCPTKNVLLLFLALTYVFCGFWSATSWLTFNFYGGLRKHFQTDLGYAYRQYRAVLSKMISMSSGSSNTGNNSVFCTQNFFWFLLFKLVDLLRWTKHYTVHKLVHLSHAMKNQRHWNHRNCFSTFCTIYNLYIHICPSKVKECF